MVVCCVYVLAANANIIIVFRMPDTTVDQHLELWRTVCVCVVAVDGAETLFVILHVCELSLFVMVVGHATI